MKIGFLAAAAVALLVAGCDQGLPQVGGQSVELKTDDMIHGQTEATAAADRAEAAVNDAGAQTASSTTADGKR